jgi:solute:Na+ symporter, SSS family
MNFGILEIAILLAYISMTLVIGLYFRKKGSGGMQDYFLGGRKMPWYLAGLSMVATTFAADTPLLVTELVSQNGISGNWLWWNMLIGGMLTVFFFAKLWRRANVITELEFVELRYGGKAGAFLRGFKAVYLGVFMNALIIGWVNLALVSILQVFFGLGPSEVLWYVFGAMFIAVVYSTISGLWGIAFTDVVQFIIAMTGSVALAVFVVSSEPIGGISGLKVQLQAISPDFLSFFPRVSSENGGTGTVLAISVLSFIAFVGVQWWASWYPGAEPGGGGYVAQRMMAAKNEKHSLLATLLFQVAHYAIRPWPWILVGLSTIVLYPELPVAEKKNGYVMAIIDFMPHTWSVIMLTALLAAYMSTISTQLNWGSSFLVNDLYKRFLKKDNTFPTEQHANKHYVWAGKLATIMIMFLSLLTTMVFDTIQSVWEFLIACGAGLGLVLILRWIWWRINAWSEIVATVVPIAVLLILNKYSDMEFPQTLFVLVGVTTFCWLLATFVTRPVNDSYLKYFYNQVRPYGWWGKVAGNDNTGVGRQFYLWLIMCWLSSIILVYSVLFSMGYLLFQEYASFVKWAGLMVVSGVVLYYAYRKTEMLERPF